MEGKIHPEGAQEVGKRGSSGAPSTVPAPRTERVGTINPAGNPRDQFGVRKIPKLNRVATVKKG